MSEITEDEFAELSAGHALNALSAEDERAYRDALAAHPEWLPVADLDAETAATLSDGAGAVAPPLELRSKILRAIAADAAGADAAPGVTAAVPEESPAAQAPVTGPLPTDVVQTAQRRNWSRGLFALVASMALLVGIGWGVGAVANLWQTPAAVTALEQIQEAPDASSAETEFEGGTATVHWSESLGKTVLVADGLPVIADDQTFELWYVRGDDAIPAGTFAADGAATTAELTGAMQPGDVIAVTVEQAGGAPDGVPTTEPILAVSTA